MPSTSRPADLTRRGTRSWTLAVRILAYGIAMGGRFGRDDAVRIAEEIGITGTIGTDARGGTRGSRPGAAVSSVMRSLEELKLAYRETNPTGGTRIVIPNLADAAAWIADELDVEDERNAERTPATG